MAAAVFPQLDAGSYRRHALHAPERDWPETNCYVDLWIEVVAARGLEPAAGLGFTVLQDFEGDQFTFFKPPPRDLKRLFGLSVLELSIYDDLVGQLALQVARGNLPLVEVDGFFLPDTKGISYRTEHTKTTVGINRIDPTARRLDYFHNAGFFRLDGDDFDGIFPRQPGDAALPPYVEFVKLEDPPPREECVAIALELLAEHFDARPRRNPVRAYAETIGEHARRLANESGAFFHKYTFNVLRQLGANFDLLASHVEWLAANGAAGFDAAAAPAREISATAKILQFQLARAQARRSHDVPMAPLERMAEAHDAAFAAIDRRLATRARRHVA